MNTDASIKLFLASPFALLILMMLASLGNGMKQLLVIRQTGTPMSLVQYLSHWPETVAMLITNLLAFAVLISLGQLNIAAAIGVGYGTNSLVDLLPGKRSLVLKSTPDDPDKTQGKAPPNG